jgi:hypothetical protein
MLYTQYRPWVSFCVASSRAVEAMCLKSESRCVKGENFANCLLSFLHCSPGRLSWEAPRAVRGGNWESEEDIVMKSCKDVFVHGAFFCPFRTLSPQQAVNHQIRQTCQSVTAVSQARDPIYSVSYYISKLFLAAGKSPAGRT